MSVHIKQVHKYYECWFYDNKLVIVDTDELPF